VHRRFAEWDFCRAFYRKTNKKILPVLKKEGGRFILERERESKKKEEKNRQREREKKKT
jgi:hypothetical protein